jgi:TonB-linked SusC/RagA family outer membrane protein
VRLRARMLGYTPGDTSVVVEEGREAVVDFRLKAQAIELEAVVAVGYGTRRSADVTGSVAAVQSENIQSLPVAGIDRALAGQVAGVQISQANGIPGGGPQLQIRGVGAIGAGTQPLYVVDGFPLSTTSSEISNPLNDIPPNDIESISVLKDASAAAIYGSRGANGVILITTKSGQSGRPRIEVSTYTSTQQIPMRGRPDLMNAQEFAQFRKEAIEDRIRFEEGREPTLEDIPEIYRNPEALGEGINWFNEITRPAPMRNLNVSVSGGSPTLSAYVSGGYLKQDGVVKETGYDRYSLRANIRANPSDRFNAGFSVASTFSRRNLLAEGGRGRYEDGFGSALVTSPIGTVTNADGSYVPMIGSPGTFLYPNPLLTLRQLEDETTNFRAIGAVFGEYALLDRVKVRSSLNVDWSDARTETFHPSTIGYLGRPPPVTPWGEYATSNYVNWLSENTLSYSGTFRESHSIDALVGASVQVQRGDSGNFRGDDFPDDDIRTLNAAARITGRTGAGDWGLISYLARLNYAYRDKYFLTAAIRRDGSSRFGPDNRWGTFPSVALGWRLSQEPFLRNASWISDLKLRTSYGTTGNFEIGDYDYLGHVVVQNYVLGQGLANGRFLNSLGNRVLGWERTREVNLGMDLSLFNGRLSLTAEAYQSHTEDLLLNVEIPQSSGFSSVTENRGRIRNRGFELALRSLNVDGKSLRWSSDFNVALNRNKALALGPSGTPILSGRSGEGSPTHITMIGQPVGMFYGYVFEGIYRSEQEIASSPAFPGAVPGNIKFRDVNGDGRITPIDDFAIIGNPYPDAILGLTNNVTYGPFHLRVLLTGALGGDRLHAFNEYLHNIDGVFNVTRDVANRWRSPERPGDGKTPTTVGTGRGRVMYRDISSLWIEDASFVSVRDVTLQYALPERWLRGVMRSASVYVGVHNALLFTRYQGNPEVTNYGRAHDQGGPLVPGVDFSNYPVPRTFTVGTQFSF